MTRAGMMVWCRKLAYKAGSRDERAIKDLFKEVWPWWNDLSTWNRNKIIGEKANPASVYLIGKINKHKHDAWVALSWRKKLWIKMGGHKIAKNKTNLQEKNQRSSNWIC